MKKLFVLFVFAASAMFVSCSSDDDNGGNEEKIIGKWEFTQEGTIVNGQEILLPYENEAPECGIDSVEFNTNNSFISFIYFLDFNDECDSDVETGTYLISENNLIITADGETTVLEIITLNNSTLKVQVTEEFEGKTFVFITVLEKV
ncbi:MAG: hypothetical protein CVU03_09415 [Bacteroidetes bacterium HGW-Bacteroidetes-2]|jgi:hypothetical protein|nr:MAG: hypothetical protein CVU03_09415 [Bacteroidetes bacterium HGW-Bacteroidetes-2]